MASIPAPPPILNTSFSLHRTFSDFLIVAIHTILYTRSLYPARTFLTSQAYNLPVHQNRHPAVCAWITSSIDSLEPLLASNSIKRVVMVIYNNRQEVLERYLFDISQFPVVDPDEIFTEFAEERGIPIVDIGEQLRATICRLEHSGGKMGKLPDNCTYTLAVELRDEVNPPIGHPQPWIPCEPGLQTGEDYGSERVGRDLGGVKSTPVRSVEAGEFVLEIWIEEGQAKFGGD